MRTADLKLIETDEGGDVVLKGNDIEMIYGFQNMPYIALFGGNVQQSTIGAKIPNEQAFDFWGNFLFNPNEPKSWFNSLTEKLIDIVSLTPATRVEIEQSVISDMLFMKPFAIITVNVELFEIDKIKILITIKEPGSSTNDEFAYIWDATQQELSQVPDQSVPVDNTLNSYIETDYIIDYFE